MATPDRIASTIEIFADDTAIVQVKFVFGNGDLITCSCAADSLDDIMAAARTALRQANALAALLPLEPEE